MRTAAGVLLIIAAVFNLMGSVGYIVGGGVASNMENIASYAEKQNGKTLSAEDKANIAAAQEKVGSSGIGLMAFGVFLLVSVGILIAGAVFLFKNTKPQFIMIAGGMAIVAEVIGILITNFGITNIVGLVAGILAIISAKSMGVGSAPEPVE